jgi:hypothetical protein
MRKHITMYCLQYVVVPPHIRILLHVKITYSLSCFLTLGKAGPAQKQH